MIILRLPQGLRAEPKYRRRQHQDVKTHTNLARSWISTPDMAREIGQLFLAPFPPRLSRPPCRDRSYG